MRYGLQEIDSQIWVSPHPHTHVLTGNDNRFRNRVLGHIIESNLKRQHVLYAGNGNTPIAKSLQATLGGHTIFNGEHEESFASLLERIRALLIGKPQRPLVIIDGFETFEEFSTRELFGKLGEIDCDILVSCAPNPSTTWPSVDYVLDASVIDAIPTIRALRMYGGRRLFSFNADYESLNAITPLSITTSTGNQFAISVQGNIAWIERPKLANDTAEVYARMSGWQYLNHYEEFLWFQRITPSYTFENELCRRLEALRTSSVEMAEVLARVLELHTQVTDSEDLTVLGLLNSLTANGVSIDPRYSDLGEIYAIELRKD